MVRHTWIRTKTSSRPNNCDCNSEVERVRNSSGRTLYLQRQRQLCICHGSALWQAGKRVSLMTVSLRNHRFQYGKVDLQGENLALAIIQPDRLGKVRVSWLYFFRIKDSSVGKWTYVKKFGTGHAWRQVVKRGSQGTVSLQERTPLRDCGWFRGWWNILISTSDRRH